MSDEAIILAYIAQAFLAGVALGFADDWSDEGGFIPFIIGLIWPLIFALAVPFILACAPHYLGRKLRGIFS